MNTETQLEFDFMKPTQGGFKFNEDLNFVDGNSNIVLAFTPSHKVLFYNKTGGEIGTLDWSSGTMKFNGDADAAGQLFFDHIIKQHIQMTLQFESQKSGWKS